VVRSWRWGQNIALKRLQFAVFHTAQVLKIDYAPSWKLWLWDVVYSVHAPNLGLIGNKMVTYLIYLYGEFEYITQLGHGSFKVRIKPESQLFHGVPRCCQAQTGTVCQIPCSQFLRHLFRRIIQLWGEVSMGGYLPHINRLFVVLSTALGVVRGTQRFRNRTRWFLLSDCRVASVLGPGVTGACDVVSVMPPSPVLPEFRAWALARSLEARPPPYGRIPHSKVSWYCFCIWYDYASSKTLRLLLIKTTRYLFST
jgi:hypothetical protein